MSLQSEAQLEAALISRLKGKGWAPVSIQDAEGLWDNLRIQLGIQNGTTFSDAEFALVRNHLKKGGVFEKAHTLRDRFPLQRDDGTITYIQFFNSEKWCQNQYQIASQVEVDGKRKNRYDVTLLVNGFPLCQIELKRRGVELSQAFNQINRYQKDSFPDSDGLFQYVQIFVISNGTNTRYCANNSDQHFKHTLEWANFENQPIRRIEPFADVFLEKCHLSKMIARYTIRRTHNKDGTRGSMMVLRPYQYYAAEQILERAKSRQDEGGYVWHTTGSGKTLTSFKAAQNVAALPEVDQVIFVVDRSDLDAQTTDEFNLLSRVPVNSTDDTHELVSHLTDNTSTIKPIVTTIQKLNNAVSRHASALDIEGVADQRVVLIFDECHRSQFGESHKRIREFFTNGQFFGFTGTPILVENASGHRTTESLFGKRLHSYVITDAIRDENVLSFSIEYIGERQDPPAPTGDAKADRAAQAAYRKTMTSRAWVNHPDRIGSITEWIIENHDRKSHHREFGAIMATGSADAAILYFDEFERRRAAGEHDLNVVTVFTYEANEDDPDADGLSQGEIAVTHATKRDRLVDFSDHYNGLYGVNTNVLDGDGFRAYNRSIAKRVKSRDLKGFDAPQGVDILIVVAMYLTGFDAKTLNTLYVDKNLRHHGLIQAFSRTNRILNDRKKHGNIC